MDRRRFLNASAAVGAGLVLWMLLRDSESDRVREKLDDFGGAVAVLGGEATETRRVRIERAFAEIFAADALAHIPDLPTAVTGREALTQAATSLGKPYAEASVSFEQPTVAVEASGRAATVNARAALSSRSRSAGLRTDSREIHVRLRKTDQGWRVTEVVVAPHSTVEPEPRP